MRRSSEIPTRLAIKAATGTVGRAVVMAMAIGAALSVAAGDGELMIVVALVAAVPGLAFGAASAIPLEIYLWWRGRTGLTAEMARGIRRCVAITAFSILAPFSFAQMAEPIAPLHTRVWSMVVVATVVGIWAWWNGRAVTELLGVGLEARSRSDSTMKAQWLVKEAQQ